MDTKKFNYRLALIIGVIGIGITTVGYMCLSSLHVANQTSTCKTETQEKIGKFAEEWADVMSRAKTGNRSNMQANISDLQNIKRRFNEVKLPQCAIVAKTTASIGMQSDIRQLLEFANGDDKKYVKSFTWKILADEIEKIATSSFVQGNMTEDSAKRIVKNLIDEEIVKANELTAPLHKQFLECDARRRKEATGEEIMSDRIYLDCEHGKESYYYFLAKNSGLEADKSLL